MHGYIYICLYITFCSFIFYSLITAKQYAPFIKKRVPTIRGSPERKVTGAGGFESGAFTLRCHGAGRLDATVNKYTIIYLCEFMRLLIYRAKQIHVLTYILMRIDEQT